MCGRNNIKMSLYSLEEARSVNVSGTRSIGPSLVLLIAQEKMIYNVHIPQKNNPQHGLWKSVLMDGNIIQLWTCRHRLLSKWVHEMEREEKCTQNCNWPLLCAFPVRPGLWPRHLSHPRPSRIEHWWSCGCLSLWSIKRSHRKTNFLFHVLGDTFGGKFPNRL